MLLTQLHIDEFSKKKYQKWPHYFFFSTVNFFCFENRENFLLSTDTNMVFPQSLSHIPLLYDQWLPRYANYPPRQLSRLHLGGCRLENGSNPPKTNFKEVLNHLSGFENYRYTFFNFQKKFFSLHPKLLYYVLVYLDITYNTYLESAYLFRKYASAKNLF